MVDCRVFEKIERYIKTIDTNTDDKITQQELEKAGETNKIPSIWMQRIEDIANGNDISTDKIYTKLGLSHAEEADEDHTPDAESDGGKYRFKNDDPQINYQQAMRSAKFFIERSVEKWFSVDINKDGFSSNIEEARWGERNQNSTMNTGDLNETEYAQQYGLQKDNEAYNNYQSWIKGWKNEILYTTAYDYGVELSEDDIRALDEYAKKQINTHLFKSGQDRTSSLYNRLGSDAYTRLITDEETVSCCGGDITPPPASPDKRSCSYVFSSMNTENSVNSAEEVKNRLAWAAFKTPPEQYLNRNKDAVTVWQDMPDGIYKTYHTKWNELRKMTAEDFRNLLKPENESRLHAFELNSSMSVQQIVDYINIVETVTGKSFDSDDWSINAEQFEEIVKRVNGTWGDETILDGKTKEDILPERQELYEYLKNNGLLLQQFI